MILGGPLSGLILFAGMVIAETLVLQNEVEWPIVIGIGVITRRATHRSPRLCNEYFADRCGLTIFATC